MAKSSEDIDRLTEEAFNYAVNFYNTHPRSLENQWKCLAEMIRITGFDDTACCTIQNPILSILMYQDTVDLANEAIQHQLRIVTGIIRQRLLEVGVSLQTETVSELPYIPKVPSKAKPVNSFEEAVQEQIPGDGCYELVDFSSKDIDYKGIDQLLYGQSRIYLGSTRDIYQGMLAKKGVTIVKLDLANCNIGALGADVIGQAIYGGSNLRCLQHLNLANNNIDDSGIYSFGNAWFCKTSPSLRTLNISNNLLTDNGANSFYWAFKQGNLYYLKYLDVSGNDGITETGWESFAAAVKKVQAKTVAIKVATADTLQDMKEFLNKGFIYYTQNHKVVATKEFQDELLGVNISGCDQTRKNVREAFLTGVAISSLSTGNDALIFLAGAEAGAGALLNPDTLNCVNELVGKASDWMNNDE